MLSNIIRDFKQSFKEEIRKKNIIETKCEYPVKQDILEYLGLLDHLINQYHH